MNQAFIPLLVLSCWPADIPGLLPHAAKALTTNHAVVTEELLLLAGMGIDDIAGLTEVCDVEQLQEVVEYRLGCNPNMKYFYRGSSKCAPPGYLPYTGSWWHVQAHCALVFICRLCLTGLLSCMCLSVSKSYRVGEGGQQDSVRAAMVDWL